MGRPYTGWNGDAKGRRAGTEKFVQLACAYFNNGLWNNGTWNVRPARGSGKPSVHGTGRAADLSWRKNGDRGFGTYERAQPAYDFFVAYADALTVEEVHDYFLKPHGRGWRCDRAAWKVYDKPTIGTPGGDWIHVEISEAHADDPAYFDNVFQQIKAGTIKPNTAVAAPAPTPAPAPALAFKFPGKALKSGSTGDPVRLVQAVLKIAETGTFDKATEDAVKAFQTKAGLKPVDGIVGKQTWATMFGA